MKKAAALLAISVLSLGGISCSQLATTGQTQPGGYANTGTNQGYYGTDSTYGQAGQQTQGGYYGSTGGYDQAQVYPQQGQGYPQAQAGGYQTPTYQSPAPPAYTPAPTYNPPAYTGGAGGRTYTVQKGDNLYRISQNHGTTVQNLMSVNGLSSDVIHPGDVLTIQ